MPNPRFRTRLAHSTLLELLHYDKRTGLLTWRVPQSRSVHPGDEAGSVRNDGFVSVAIKGKRWQANRLIWYYVTGEIPRGRMFFKDRDPQNLRWANLALESDVLSSSPAAVYQREHRRIRNGFKQLIDEARERAMAAGFHEEPVSHPTRPTEQVEDEEAVPEIQRVRMPYSSDPEPIGEAWDSNDPAYHDRVEPPPRRKPRAP